MNDKCRLKQVWARLALYCFGTLASVHVFLSSGICASETIVARGAEWKYNDSGDNLGTDWRNLSYDDSAWSSGNAVLGYGYASILTHLYYGPDPHNRFITYYFRKQFRLADPKKYSLLSLKIIRDNGAVAYLNGKEIFRSNMPQGKINYLTTASTSGHKAGGSDTRTWQVTEVDPGKLTEGNNVLAIEIHQASGKNTDLAFDCQLIGATREPVAATFPWFQKPGPSAINPARPLTETDAPAASACKKEAAPIAAYLLLLLAVGGVFYLSFTLMLKLEKVRFLEDTVSTLRRSLDEMDEQAKLIVRTDMELNKTQEELDKKLNALYALQKLSRQVSTTLEESQIFQSIDPESLEDLGFEKTCCFLWREKQSDFLSTLVIGYPEERGKAINQLVSTSKDIFLPIILREKSLSSILVAQDQVVKEKIKQVFAVHSFVIVPILPKEGVKGFLFAGTENADFTITEGDEELITLFANQIGQALENARLFEKTWRAHQELEKKVEERTRELTSALEEVKRMSKRKSDFISAVAHELRTPLTSIKGYASILLAGKLGDFPEEARLRIEKINRHSDSLAHLVNDLLDISRIESGRVAMKQESLDLVKIVNQVADLLSVQFKDRAIEFSSHIPADASTAFADHAQINRVFINIIGNATKFTPAHGTITVQTHKADTMVQVDIRDTGCGIPKEAQEAIFEEFYRVDNPINETVKGTGLGLTLVKHIVEAHGGKIWVTSILQQGSTFSFTLPCAKAPQQIQGAL